MRGFLNILRFRLPAWLGRLMLRWLETLGENPPPTPDHGLCAWHYLRQPSCSPAVPADPSPPCCAMADDPTQFLLVGA